MIIVYSFFFFLNWYFHSLLFFKPNNQKHFPQAWKEPHMCPPPALAFFYHTFFSTVLPPQLYSFLCWSWSVTPSLFLKTTNLILLTLLKEASTSMDVLLPAEQNSLFHSSALVQSSSKSEVHWSGRDKQQQGYFRHTTLGISPTYESIFQSKSHQI